MKEQRGRVLWKTTTAHGESSKPLTRWVGGRAAGRVGCEDGCDARQARQAAGDCWWLPQCSAPSSCCLAPALLAPAACLLPPCCCPHCRRPMPCLCTLPLLSECSDHDAQALQAVLPAGWGVVDAFTLTRPLAAMRQPPYWDNIHFTGGCVCAGCGGWVGAVRCGAVRWAGERVGWRYRWEQRRGGRWAACLGLFAARARQSPPSTRLPRAAHLPLPSSPAPLPPSCPPCSCGVPGAESVPAQHAVPHPVTLFLFIHLVFDHSFVRNNAAGARTAAPPADAAPRRQRPTLDGIICLVA